MRCRRDERLKGWGLRARVLRMYLVTHCPADLKNIIERALIESGGGPIQQRHIHLLEAVPRRQRSANVEGSSGAETIPLNLDAAEQLLIQRALNQAGGNVAEAARLLGVNRSRIYRRFPNQV